MPVGGTDVVDVRQVWQLVGDEFSLLPAVDRGLIEQAWKALVASCAGDLQDIVTVDISSSLLEAPMYREKTWRIWTLKQRAEDVTRTRDEFVQGRAASKTTWGQGSAGSLRFTAPLQHGPARSDTRLGVTVALSRAWVLEESPPVARTLVMGYRSGPWEETSFSVNPGVPALLGRWVTCTRTVAGEAVIRVGGDGAVATTPAATTPWNTLVGQYESVGPGEDLDVLDLSAQWYPRDGHEYVHVSLVRRSTQDVVFDATILAHGPGHTTVTGILVGSWSDALAGQGLGVASVVADPEAPALATDFRWTDPSLPPDLRFIPVLQSVPVASPPPRFWYHDIDFNVVPVPKQKTTYLRTGLSLPDTVWAESNAFLNREAERQLVPLSGLLGVLDEEEGEALRQKVFGALWALNKGPTVSALASAATSLSGGAIAVAAGVVVDIRNQEIDVVDPVGYRTYPYAEGLRVAVDIGDAVVPGQPLTTPAQVSDWVLADGNLSNFLEHEYQKYTAVTARVAYVPGVYDSWPSVIRAIERLFRLALPVWVNVYRTLVRAVSTLTDDIELRDRWRISGTLSFFDNFGEVPTPRYSESAGLLYGDDGQAGPPVYDQHFYVSLRDEVIVTTSTEDEPAGLFPLQTSEGLVSWEQLSTSGVSRGRGVYDWPVSFTLQNTGDGTLTFVIDAVVYVLTSGDDPVLVQTWSSTPEGDLSFDVTNDTASTQTVEVVNPDSTTTSTTIPPSGTVTISISYSNAPQ
jgi:hypothetical protein